MGKQTKRMNIFVQQKEKKNKLNLKKKKKGKKSPLQVTFERNSSQSSEKIKKCSMEEKSLKGKQFEVQIKVAKLEQ